MGFAFFLETSVLNRTRLIPIPMYHIFRFIMACAFLLGFAFIPSKAPKKMSITLEGSSDYTHYSKPLMVIATNHNKTKKSYTLKKGQVVKTPDHQDLLITETFVATVGGSTTDTFYVPSMCIQERMPAPVPGCPYTLAPKEEWLTQEADRLAKTRLSRADQQQLLWALASGYTYAPSKLSPETLAQLNAIRAERGLPQIEPYIDDPEISGDYASNRRPNVRRVSSIKGYFEVDYSRTYMTHIGLFNEDNILVQVILEEQPVKGRKRVHYTFNPDDYRGQTLYARLIIEGQVELEREIRL